MTTQTKDINMISGGVRSYVNVSQYDVGSEIKFALYNNSSAFTPPAGTTVRVEGRKPDGNGFSYSASLSDNVVTVTVTDQMTVLSGEVLCELRLTKDSVDIGTANFILAVEESPINENTPTSETDIPVIIALAREEQYTAEAWAKGTRDGQAVSSDDETYHNNAKYYSDQARGYTPTGYQNLVNDINWNKSEGYLQYNLLDPQNLGHNVRNNSTGEISGSGDTITSNTELIKVQSGKSYMMSYNGLPALVRYFLYNASKQFVNTLVLDSLALTIPDNVKYIAFQSGTANDDLTKWQLEEGTSITAFVPYANPNTKLASISSLGTNETGLTASKAYAAGAHFYKDGKFCTAKKAIANGATLTLNTNYIEGTVGDNQTSLLSSDTAVNNSIISVSCTPYLYSYLQINGYVTSNSGGKRFAILVPCKNISASSQFYIGMFYANGCTFAINALLYDAKIDFGFATLGSVPISDIHFTSVIGFI